MDNRSGFSVTGCSYVVHQSSTSTITSKAASGPAGQSSRCTTWAEQSSLLSCRFHRTGFRLDVRYLRAYYDNPCKHLTWTGLRHDRWAMTGSFHQAKSTVSMLDTHIPVCGASNDEFESHPLSCGVRTRRHLPESSALLTWFLDRVHVWNRRK